MSSTYSTARARGVLGGGSAVVIDHGGERTRIGGVLRLASHLTGVADIDHDRRQPTEEDQGERHQDDRRALLPGLLVQEVTSATHQLQF